VCVAGIDMEKMSSQDSQGKGMANDMILIYRIELTLI